MAGLILVGVLTHHNVKGSILIGILSVTLFSWYIPLNTPKKTQLPPHQLFTSFQDLQD